MAAVATSRAESYGADVSRISLRWALLVATAIAAGFALWIQAELRAANPDFAGFDTWGLLGARSARPVHLAADLAARNVPVRSASRTGDCTSRPPSVGGCREAWGVAQIGLLAALVGPLAVPLALTQPVRLELVFGNVNLLIAGAVLIGLRWPALWSIPILMKVTPAGGLLWFVARREWPGTWR